MNSETMGSIIDPAGFCDPASAREATFANNEAIMEQFFLRMTANQWVLDRDLRYIYNINCLMTRELSDTI